MKKILFYVDFFLDQLVKETKGKLFIVPAVLAALISGATTLGTKVVEDIRANKLAKKADKEAAQEKLENAKIAERGLDVVKGIVRQGDPTLAAKQQQIQTAASNTIGKAVGSSQSVQEIINAAQKVQGIATSANINALSEAGQFQTNAKSLLASKFGEAGRLRLAGNAAIDQRLQEALNAIGYNAQAGVSTVSNIGKMVTDAVIYGGKDPYNRPTV